MTNIVDWVRHLYTLVHMYRSGSDTAPASWDVVKSCERAGVRVTWMRRREDDDQPKHMVTVQPLSGDEVGEELGPHDRKRAEDVYESIAIALLVAARQQRSRLRGIMQRRTRAAAILSARRVR
jgi:hypothetical protein